jgi:hypothetical protein
LEFPRVRLYQSALNGVTYVYHHPVRFSAEAETLERRDVDKQIAVQRAADRHASLERCARERRESAHG